MDTFLLPLFLMFISNSILLAHSFFILEPSFPKQWFCQAYQSADSTFTVTMMDPFQLAHQEITFPWIELYSGVETWQHQENSAIRNQCHSRKTFSVIFNFRYNVSFYCSLLVLPKEEMTEDKINKKPWDKIYKIYKYLMTLHEHPEIDILKIGVIYRIFNIMTW